MTSEASSGKADRHKWVFFRQGGFDQVRLDSGQDLASLDQLDQKLWVALACPTQGLDLDARTLELIDSDGDGRIRATEILAATRWACGLLKDPGTLTEGAAALKLDALNDQTPDGRRLLESARQILANQGKSDSATISIEDTTDTVKIFAQTTFNGDGIVPADAATDPAVQAVIGDVIACAGAQTDRSGKPGVTQEAVDKFFADAQAYEQWWAAAEKGAADILPLGEATVAAAGALAAVRTKVEDFFARCRLAAFDARALAALNRQESEYLAIAAGDLTITSTEVAGFPLASIAPGRTLPLSGPVNPAWAEALGRLAELAVRPLLGEKDALTEEDWRALKARFADYDAWSAGKKGGSVEALGIARIREILAGASKAAIAALIARDKALETHANSIAEVDKLVRFNRDLVRLLNNFVTFREFYRRREKAIFLAGTLYMDQRSCDLCIRVNDLAKHVTMAHLSRNYLVYCDLVRRSSGEKMTIAAAFTAGDGDNLMVGRNGIFYDRQGRDWDATIVKIVESPISVGQAFMAPYKRVLRMIEELAAKRASTADTAATGKLAGSVETTTKAAQTGKAPDAKPKIDIGVVAAIGVAVGGIAAAFGALLQAFFGLGVWMPVGVLAMILLISGPSMVIAWLKLRQRNIGPILDANGWAVNARVRINLPFGRSLTRVAHLPAGARRDLADPYAEKKTLRRLVSALVILGILFWGLWNFGVIERVAPGVMPKSGWVKHRDEERQRQEAERLRLEQQKQAPPAPATQPSK
ncbi:MAG: hypothetical protein BIFFINMI_01590 [Phycisphaerae bacterium]|nr:hypothetical protein [Phycisphaerae bacterium]